MSDNRIDNLARILVEHSTRVAPGDVCLIEGEAAGECLIAACYEAVLRAGGNPIVAMTPGGSQASFFELASDDQLDWIAPTLRWAAEESDVRIRIMASQNTRELSQIDPARQTRRQKAMAPVMSAMMERAAAGQHRWALTLFPTNAYAAGAGMSLRAYQDFYYRACLADVADPVAAWAAASAETSRLAEWMSGREEVKISGPGTDLTVAVGGRTFIAADGTHNMPDGEFFTGPIEDSAEGHITYHLPATYAGREVAGVKLRFAAGKVIDASAERGQDFLIEMLDTDPGARRLGELGIGTNFGITAGSGEILLDEKIGGTVHLAVGKSYPDTGGRNESAIHWDMICDLRQGGQITVDGELLQRDGRFVV